MPEVIAVVAFLEASVRLGIPLALAAMGETITERSGVINIGLEGSLIAGALGGALGALAIGGAGGGILVGAFGGALVAMIFCGVCCRSGDRSDHHRDCCNSGWPRVHGCNIPGSLWDHGNGTNPTYSVFSSNPVALGYSNHRVGPLQSGTNYVFHLSVGTNALVFRVPYGVGVGIKSCWRGTGCSCSRWRSGEAESFLGNGFGGTLAGIAGAHLALAHAGTFAENMSAGRGFIAIAVVVLGRWNPPLVLLAALFFGAASALQFQAQTLGLAVPYQLFLAFPYLLTLLALAGWVGKSRAPASLALPWPKDS